MLHMTCGKTQRDGIGKGTICEMKGVENGWREKNMPAFELERMFKTVLYGSSVAKIGKPLLTKQK